MVTNGGTAVYEEYCVSHMTVIHIILYSISEDNCLSAFQKLINGTVPYSLILHALMKSKRVLTHNDHHHSPPATQNIVQVSYITSHV